MKKYLSVIMVLILGYIMNLQGYQPSSGGQLVNEIIAKTAEAVKNEYGLQPCGASVSMPGGPIKTINLSFTSYQSYSKDDLRSLLIKIADKVVVEVNKNKEIQKFLLKTPFNEKNVNIVIFNYNEKREKLYDPAICGAQISEDGLMYRTNDIEVKFKYKNEYEETYEEALRLIN